MPPFDSAQLMAERTYRQKIARRPGAEEALVRLGEETFDLGASSSTGLRAGRP
jgi:hypothetical protein